MGSSLPEMVVVSAFACELYATPETRTPVGNWVEVPPSLFHRFWMTQSSDAS